MVSGMHVIRWTERPPGPGHRAGFSPPPAAPSGQGSWGVIPRRGGACRRRPRGRLPVFDRRGRATRRRSAAQARQHPQAKDSSDIPESV